MEYFMMPTEKIPSLQQFKKTEKDVIGGLCRCVASYFFADKPAQFIPRVAVVCVCVCDAVLTSASMLAASLAAICWQRERGCRN